MLHDIGDSPRLCGPSQDTKYQIPTPSRWIIRILSLACRETQVKNSTVPFLAGTKSM
jgi:hypothetical protein